MLDAKGQFPFTSAYSFFTGTCAIQSPVKNGLADYFSATNKAAAILGDPDSIQKPQLATVFQPALNLRLRASSSNANPTPSTFDATSMKVFVYLQPVNGETCSGFQGTQLSVKNWPGTGWGSPAQRHEHPQLDRPEQHRLRSRPAVRHLQGVPAGRQQVVGDAGHAGHSVLRQHHHLAGRDDGAPAGQRQDHRLEELDVLGGVRMMHRLRREDGFTLPELLTTMAIAMIVSLATFTLIEIVMKRSGEVCSRVETTATARTAMDQITRQLRSQVCAKTSTSTDARSLATASPTS